MRLVAPASVAACLLVVLLAWAQGGNPPASTKESKATSGKGMTAVEQTGKGGGNVEQQIKTLSDQLVQALLKGDTGFFEKYYADDAVIVRGAGKVFPKAQDIENLKSGALRFEAYNVREQKTHTYGDTAVVNLLASARGSGEGQAFSGDYRVTWVWVKQKGNWKLALYQVTSASP
jgi:uncharacterized protein (TIGR02246 family)